MPVFDRDMESNPLKNAPVRLSCKDLILRHIDFYRKPRAVHEIEIDGYNQNNIATRLNDLEREGELKSRVRAGVKYKEWYRESWYLDKNGQFKFF